MNNIDDIAAYLYDFGVRNNGCEKGQEFLLSKPDATKTLEFLLENLGSDIGLALKEDDRYERIMTFLLENFDRGEFDWKKNSWALAWYCSEHFGKWFDADRYNWTNGSGALAIRCSVHFDKWFDADRFNWTNGSWDLANFCSEHKHVWGKFMQQQ